MNETTDEFDFLADVERRLVSADLLFDAGPEQRRASMERYAECADWIDPCTPQGEMRLSRVLGDPFPIDPRFAGVLSRAADTSPDPDLRWRSRFAAVRLAIAAGEFARAEASLTKAARGLHAETGRSPPTLDGLLALVYLAQGRETEALAAIDRSEAALTPAAEPVGHLALASYRADVDGLLGAWDEGLRAADRAIARAGAVESPELRAFASSLERSRSWFLAMTGDGPGARAALVASRNVLGVGPLRSRDVARARLDDARVFAAEGKPAEALSASLEVAANPDARPADAAAAYPIAATAVRAMGREREAAALATGFLARVAEWGERLGTGAALIPKRDLLDAVRGADGADVAERLLARAAITSMATRAAEIVRTDVSHAVREPIPAETARRLAAFRREFVATRWTTDPFRVPGVEEAVAVLDRELRSVLPDIDEATMCAACLRVATPSGRLAPVGHLVPPGRLRHAPCADCAA